MLAEMAKGMKQSGLFPKFTNMRSSWQEWKCILASGKGQAYTF